MNSTPHSPIAECVSLDQVLRVAELAQLELTPEEQQGMLHDLNAILGHVEQLKELDTSSVPAMTQVGEILHTLAPEGDSSSSNGQGAALRDDARRPSLDRNAVMSEAPETDGVYFKVPRVIER